MSLTKRHIDSLPRAEQDAILGVHNPDEEDEFVLHDLDGNLLRGLPLNRPCTVRAQMPEICGVVCNCGPNAEPIACAYEFDHDGAHSWAGLPTYTAGRFDITFATEFKELWVLRKNGKVQALFSFEPSVDRMAKSLRMTSDAVTMKIFQSRTSGIDCGWEPVQESWGDWPVIVK